MQNTTSPHIPVLLQECLDALNVRQDGHYLDATGGYGGHSSEILKLLGTSGHLDICDWHHPTFLNLQKKFSSHKNVSVHHIDYADAAVSFKNSYDGILADFGISSPQLEDESLGIGFQQLEAPLDMRIALHAKETARDILYSRTREELANIFYEYGGEAKSRTIAAAITYDIEHGKNFDTVKELASLCERVLGKFYRGKKIHPATKVFQALRIEVNQELKSVETFIKNAPQKLNANGRLVVISFHEGEDRLAKIHFKEISQIQNFKLLTKKAITASEQELKINPRARSAKLRAIIKEAA